MRRVAVLSAAALGITLFGVVSARSGDDPPQPLCALSPSAETETYSLDGRLGVAVVDTRTGALWSGGEQEAFTLHSISHLVLAFAAAMQFSDEGVDSAEELHTLLYPLVVRGEGWAARRVWNWLGGANSVYEFYLRVRAEQLVSGVDHNLWGRSRGRVEDVARMLSSVTSSPELSPAMRGTVYELMSLTWSASAWRGVVFPMFSGWQVASETGWYIPEWRVFQIHQVFILIDPSGEERYVIAVMYDGRALSEHIWLTLNAIQRALAQDLSLRESGDAYGDQQCQQLGLWLSSVGPTNNASNSDPWLLFATKP